MLRGEVGEGDALAEVSELRRGRACEHHHVGSGRGGGGGRRRCGRRVRRCARHAAPARTWATRRTDAVDRPHHRHRSKCMCLGAYAPPPIRAVTSSQISPASTDSSTPYQAIKALSAPDRQKDHVRNNVSQPRPIRWKFATFLNHTVQLLRRRGRLRRRRTSLCGWRAPTAPSRCRRWPAGRGQATCTTMSARLARPHESSKHTPEHGNRCLRKATARTPRFVGSETEDAVRQ